jgi:hypothetical protein
VHCLELSEGCGNASVVTRPMSSNNVNPVPGMDVDHGDKPSDQRDLMTHSHSQLEQQNVTYKMMGKLRQTNNHTTYDANVSRIESINLHHL